MSSCRNMVQSLSSNLDHSNTLNWLTTLFGASYQSSLSLYIFYKSSSLDTLLPKLRILAFVMSFSIHNTNISFSFTSLLFRPFFNHQQFFEFWLSLGQHTWKLLCMHVQIRNVHNALRRLKYVFMSNLNLTYRVFFIQHHHQFFTCMYGNFWFDCFMSLLFRPPFELGI